MSALSVLWLTSLLEFNTDESFDPQASYSSLFLCLLDASLKALDVLGVSFWETLLISLIWSCDVI